MFRFAVLVLAGIGLGALLFGGAQGAGAGIGFLALIPLFFILKILFIAMIFGALARSGYRSRMSRDEFRAPWMRSDWMGRRPSRHREDPGPSADDRFEEWHRMAHAKDEVDSWAPEPE